ncbi:cupin domain-containing protein [Clostridium intestinale]|uniref:Cupin domain-containing protein n=1 Tax=Clostridium intestinale TaxID=36845 RepID=A0A7D6W304_9CLOT|nr:cupin domain-containing protein [Clostridium intestinale]QLY81585.1 cupin domain-containing protein [Clostridium intestinale]
MELDIFTKLDGISVTKENKTDVDYFIFDEFEIHLNKIPPNVKQEWHKHKIIEEVLVVTKGELIVKWKEDESTIERTVLKDNIVRVKKSIHTIENHTNEWAEFTVFRMVPSGEDKRDTIKKDKVIIDI